MKGKAAIRISVLTCMVLVLTGSCGSGIAPAAEGSKLTIAYTADEIGRIEPCG